MKKITKNNKGFSLIELIIVIAIMAVLVAIIAPNLTKYLGSSKNKTDRKNIDEILTQVQNSISDYESEDGHGYLGEDAGSMPITITWAAGGTVSGIPTTVSDFQDSLTSAVTSSAESKEVKGNYATVKIEWKDASGDPTKGYKLTGELGKLTGSKAVVK